MAVHTSKIAVKSPIYTGRHTTKRDTTPKHKIEPMRVARPNWTIPQQIKRQNSAALKVAFIASRMFDGYGWDGMIKNLSKLQRAVEHFDTCYVEEEEKAKHD